MSKISSRTWIRPWPNTACVSVGPCLARALGAVAGPAQGRALRDFASESHLSLRSRPPKRYRSEKSNTSIYCIFILLSYSLSMLYNRRPFNNGKSKCIALKKRYGRERASSYAPVERLQRRSTDPAADGSEPRCADGSHCARAEHRRSLYHAHIGHSPAGAASADERPPDHL